MHHRLSSRLRSVRLPRASYANVVATLALFIALSGGTAWAATSLIHGRQIARGTITAANIKARSLLANDFKKDQLPRGARGATGARGSVGATGPAGVAGPAGPTGAQGSAAAYATIVIQSDGSPEVIGEEQGFTGQLTSPRAGVYCLGYGNTNILPPLLVTPYNTDATFAPVTNQDCSFWQYEIKLLAGTASAGTGFVAAVP